MATTMNADRKPVALVVGASRGIGRQIAIDLAREGYYVVVSAKSVTPENHPSLTTNFPPDPNSALSTITTVREEIVAQGRSCLALPCDVRDVDSIKDLVDQTVDKLGSLDVLVYNSGAIWWSAVETTPVKRFQLMQRVNPEGLYATVQAALPHFRNQQWRGRIVVVSPPIYSRFFRGKTAYAMGKVGMSVLTKGLAMDFDRQGHKDMAITSIWPASAIQSAATEKNPGPSFTKNDRLKDLRHASIFSDAIIAMLSAPTNLVNGLLDTDEDFLRRVAGFSDTDFDRYNLVPGGAKPRRIMPAEFPTLEVKEQNDEGVRMDSMTTRPSDSVRAKI